MASTNYLAITFDGGGIRGLITAMLLQDLEHSCQVLERTNLLAGTSTGGIIALGLAANVSPQSLVNLYKNDGATIFTPYEPSLLTLHEQLVNQAASLQGSLFSIQELFSVKYDNKGLQSVLNSTVPGNPKFSDLTKKVLVTTFQLGTPTSAWMPTSISNLTGSVTADTRVIDAALATSAAPVYFPPYLHPTLGYCVDGGTFANNPSSFTLAAILKQEIPLSSIKMLSLGTGITLDSLPTSDPLSYGVLEWLWPWTKGTTPAFPLLSLLMDGSASVDTEQCQLILQNNFRRANVMLPINYPLDDYQEVNTLANYATTYMQSSEWAAVKTWVTQQFV